MRFKILLLIFTSSLLTYLIYNHYYQNEVNIVSINSLAKDYDYNKSLSERLYNKTAKVKFNVDFSDETLEIENLIAEIQNNRNKIQTVIHNSKILILSIGNNDINNETSKTMLNEYKLLFVLLRKYSNKQIIFISPYNFKYQAELKNLANNYSLEFINYSSYCTNTFINLSQINKLTNNIVNKIYYLK